MWLQLCFVLVERLFEWLFRWLWEAQFRQAVAQFPPRFSPDELSEHDVRYLLIHGIFVAALFPRIISSHFPGAIYVSQSLQFRFPVYVGDEITGEVEAMQIRENRGRYMAEFKMRCLKAGGLIVIEGDATAVLQSLAIE